MREPLDDVGPSGLMIALLCCLKQRMNVWLKWFHLWAAARSGDVGVLQRVLAGGDADVNMTEPGCLSTEETALHQACQCGHEDVVRYLVLEAGADVTMKTIPLGYTPLDVACVYGHVGIARLLWRLRPGVAYDLRRCLRLAINYRHVDVCVFLIEEVGVHPMHGVDDALMDSVNSACWMYLSRVMSESTRSMLLRRVHYGKGVSDVKHEVLSGVMAEMTKDVFQELMLEYVDPIWYN